MIWLRLAGLKGIITKLKWNAKVAELVDAPDLGSGAVRCGGSSPPFRTKWICMLLQSFLFDKVKK